MTPDSSNAAVEIFYSYSRADEDLRVRLEKHLAGLRQAGVIRGWHDREIRAGDDWAAEIHQHLLSAHIILLLISADFLASEYIASVEVAAAMERQGRGEAVVIPIVLRPVDWKTTRFSKLQALPTDAKPVTSWSTLDEAFLNVAEGIRAAVEQLTNISEVSAEPRAPLWNFKPNVPEILPYLCDRSDQERELSLALREHQESGSRRPFLCITHGDERECHSEFLGRMQETAMTNVLNLKQRQLSVEEYRLQWSFTATGFERVLWSNLGEALLENSAATKDEILQFIAAHERPLVITSRVLTDDFASGTGLCHEFISFWNNWPDLPPGRSLISWMCLKYQKAEHVIWDWKKRRRNEQLRSFLAGLSFSSFTNLNGVVLPELKAIREVDVIAWVHSKPVRAVCRIKEKDITELFQRDALHSPDGRISMELLADELSLLAQRSRI